MSLFRLLGVGGVIAYRALFNWTSPTMFVCTLFLAPLTQLFFFVFLGRQLDVADDRFFIVGNAVLAATMACVFGGTMAVANERRYGTLGSVLLSPRSRTAIFLGRAIPYAGNGVLVAAFTLGVGSLLLGVRLPVSSLPGLALTLVVAAISCGFFGLTLGAIGLRLRDIWLISNVAVALLVLVTGVNVPAENLPIGVRAIGQIVPVTHAAEAARRLSDGAGLGAALPQIAAELAVGVGYGLLAAVLLRVFEVEARRRASLDAL